MLIYFNARPILVFDGADLPMKAGTHAERRQRREEALKKAEAAMAAGDARKAEEFYQRSFFVNSDMARNVIRECRKHNVEYIVAPYEADAQLAWMIQTGYIDSIITEDSDMLVYGASKVFYKMNRDGMGDMFESKNLPALETVSLRNFTQDMFMYMCVCSGCDFFKGVQGLGIKKAHTVVKRYRTLLRVLQAIRREPRYRVSPSFNIDFTRACLVFRHQTVYDMKQKRHAHLRNLDLNVHAKMPPGVLQELDDGSFDLSFLGVHREPNVARKIAEALVHPQTLQEYKEPLDTISRSLRPTRRPRRFASPPPKRLRITPQQPKKTFGFQVQPASSRPITPSTDSLHLRQKPTGRSSVGPFSFNPRQIGSTFKAQSTADRSRASVWSNFRRSSKVDNSNSNTSPEKVSDSEDFVANCESHATDEIKSLAKISEQQGDTRSCADISAESQTRVLSDAVHEHPPVNRPRSSSHRVDAVNRALGRFARTKERDLKAKFVPNPKPSPPSSPKPPGPSSLEQMTSLQPLARPASPDADSYRLFELVERESSIEVQKQDGPSKAPEKSPKSKARIDSHTPGKQLRLSRFFKPRVGLAKPKRASGSSNSSKLNAAMKMKGPGAKTASSVGLDVSAIDRFKRK